MQSLAAERKKQRSAESESVCSERAFLWLVTGGFTLLNFCVTADLLC